MTHALMTTRLTDASGVNLGDALTIVEHVDTARGAGPDREQGGAPSVQASIALDRRHAGIDVDYRSSSSPIGLFDGHLTAANSDVRAGNN